MADESTLRKIIHLYKQGKRQEGIDQLKNVLREDGTVSSLLWFAKMTDKATEALAAIDTALALEPDNEIARRARIAIQQQIASQAGEMPKVDVTQLTGMTLAEAQAVIWPFRGERKPVAVLLEKGEVTERDLVWAVQNAYDPRIQQAAKTILLSRLFPEKLGKPLQIAPCIAGESYTARQRRVALTDASFLAGIAMGIPAVFLSLVMLIVWVNSLSGYSKALLSNIGMIVLFIVVPLIFLWFANQYAEAAESYAIGEEAENQAVDALRSLLHEPWVVFRSFRFPREGKKGKSGDIDVILVGPGGIWAVEVKGYTRPIRIRGDRWQYRSRWGWREISKNPGRQARQNARRLKDYLDLKGVNVSWVQPVVLMAGSDVAVEDSETPVWRVTDLPHVEDFWHRQKLDLDRVEQVVQVLKQAMEADRTKRHK